jgi:hypothetical protein
MDTGTDTNGVKPGYGKYSKIGLDCDGVDLNILTNNCSAI